MHKQPMAPQKQKKGQTTQANSRPAPKATVAASSSGLLALQEHIGNGAVQRWLVQRGDESTAPFEPFSPTAQADSADSARPMLQRGSTGPGVVELQTKLNAAGATPPLVVDGIFGAKTQAAVMAFQQDQDLDADGIVGPQTWAALDRPATTSDTDSAESTVESKTEPDEVHGFGPVATNADKVKGAEANEIFQRILTKPPSGAEDTVPGVPVGDLAKALIPDNLLPQILNTTAVTSVSSFFVIRPGDLGTARAALLVLKLAVMEVSTKGALQPEQQQLLLERIGNLDTFYESQFREPVQAVSSQRQTIISIALSQVGAVQEGKGEGVDPQDPQKREFRVGRKNLLEYFRTANPDPKALNSDDQINHLPKDNIVDWCGIFALWAYKSAGFSLGNWTFGATIPAIPGFEQVAPSKNVKPGDVGLQAAGVHHYIVVEVNGDKLATVEGNTNGSGGASGGEIAMHQGKRTISGTNFGFWRPKGLK